MPRILTATLALALAQPETSVGYLIQWGSLARWCDIGTVTFNSNVFIEYDFTISGLVQDPDADFECRVSAENVDNAAAALFLNCYTPDLVVDIWQTDRSALGVMDPQKLCTLVTDGMSISPEKFEVVLKSTRSLAAFAPRRRVDSTYGFFYALPANSQVYWENEVYTVDEEQDTSA